MKVNLKISGLTLSLLLFLLMSNISAQLTLPSIFNDNMVLQQNFEAPIWGWAEPGTEVIISGSWSRMPAKTTIAGKDGKWMLKLKTTKPKFEKKKHLQGKKTQGV